MLNAQSVYLSSDLNTFNKIHRKKRPSFCCRKMADPKTLEFDTEVSTAVWEQHQANFEGVEEDPLLFYIPHIYNLLEERRFPFFYGEQEFVISGVRLGEVDLPVEQIEGFEHRTRHYLSRWRIVVEFPENVQFEPRFDLFCGFDTNGIRDHNLGQLWEFDEANQTWSVNNFWSEDGDYFSIRLQPIE